MKLPRFLHRIYAWMFGYFWLPCPACGRMFGGHEVLDRPTLIDEGLGELAVISRCVCSDECAARAVCLNLGSGAYGQNLLAGMMQSMHEDWLREHIR